MSLWSGFCWWCFRLIFVLGLTALFLWLLLRPSKPSLSIHKFTVPALNRTAPDHENATIAFNLRLKNNNKDKGVYYDALNVTIYHGPNRSEVPGGHAQLPGFYQGHKKTATKAGSAQVEVGENGTFWKGIMEEEGNNGNKTIFRVKVVTRVRYKILGWKTKKHGVKMEKDVEVGQEGKQAAADLSYRAPDAALRCLQALVLYALTLVW